MDQTLLTVENFDNTVQQQNEFLRHGFNITVDTEIDIIQNQIAIFELLCHMRLLFLWFIFLLVILAGILVYLSHLVEKLQNEEIKDDVKDDVYVELKDSPDSV